MSPHSEVENVLLCTQYGVSLVTKIRLKRLGKKKQPFYRVVIADSRVQRDGQAIEEIGKYNPTQQPSLIEFNSERVAYWLGVGAQPTETVKALLKVTGDWQKFKGEKYDPSTYKLKPAKESVEDRIAAQEALAEKLKAENSSKLAKAAADAAAAKEAEPEVTTTDVLSSQSPEAAAEPVAEEALATAEPESETTDTAEPEVQEAAPEAESPAE